MRRLTHKPKNAGRNRATAKLILCVGLAAAFPTRAADDLTALSLEQLMGLTVVGASKYEQKQSEVAAAVSIITRDEIRAFGWQTVGEALASLPGVHTTQDNLYTYIGMRGFGLPGDFNTRVLVTVNGNRVNDPIYDYGPIGLELPLDLDLVERIEFIPGPGGAVYGQNAMFGVVNLVTREGRKIDGTELALSTRSPQAQREGRVTWGKQFDNGTNVLLSVSGLYARGEDRFFSYGTTGISGTAAGLDHERDRNVFLRLQRGPWSIEMIEGARRKGDPTAAYFTDPLAPGQYIQDTYQLGQAHYQESFADNTLQASARVFVGKYRFEEVGVYGTPFLSLAAGDWHGVELRLVSSALANHKLMAGLELQVDSRRDLSFLDTSAPANDIVVPGSGYRQGVYVQDEWRASESLVATVGLRLDHNDRTGTQASPRAALVWQAGTATTLKALYGRAHRAPNSFERDYADGVSQVANPALKGESIDTLELVADQRVGSDLHLRGSAYQWTMRDLITQGIDPSSGLPQFQSGDDVKAKGLEVSADKTWSGGGRLRGSVSIQRVHQGGNTRLLNSPRLLAKLNYSAPLPWAGLRLGYEVQYNSQRLTLDGSELGGYAVSNLHLGTDKWVPGLELGLGVRNLFDKRYQHPAADFNWQNAFDQSGRSVRFEARYRF